IIHHASFVALRQGVFVLFVQPTESRCSVTAEFFGAEIVLLTSHNCGGIMTRSNPSQFRHKLIVFGLKQGGNMKKLVLLLVLSFLTSGVAYTFSTSRGDDPQFKIKTTGSDGAGFDVDYSWPGEGKDPVECTVTVRVKYSANGNKGGGSEEFKMT